jgi:HK97 gp10 family phage protein
MADDVEVRVHDAAIVRLAGELGMRNALLDATRPRLMRAKASAPRETGGGAASIHAEAVLDRGSWEVRASWDREHYYMHMHEGGTKYMPPRPFLVPAFG